MTMFLPIVLAAYLGTARPEDRCASVDDAQIQHYREIGERLFLAYVDHKVSKYEIAPMKCDNDIVVVIAGTGDDARVGDIWTITFHDADKSVVIRPGM
jgi:hypothetical protein